MVFKVSRLLATIVVTILNPVTTPLPHPPPPPQKKENLI